MKILFNESKKERNTLIYMMYNNNCIYLRSTESNRAANRLNYYVSFVTIAWGLDWCPMYGITRNKIKL